MALTESEELELLELEAQEQTSQSAVDNNAAFAANREAIEPGIMGETSPTGQRLLENAGIAAGGYGAGQLGGMIGKAALKPLGAVSDFARGIVQNPKTIGDKIGALEKAKGVTGHLPELRGSQTTFPPPEMNLPTGGTPTSYPLDKNTFLNSASERMGKWGKQLHPQEVTDYHRQISDWMNRGKINPGSPIGVEASKISKRASGIQNELVEGREALSAAYHRSKDARETLKKVKDFLLNKYTGTAAAGAVGYKALH